MTIRSVVRLGIVETKRALLIVSGYVFANIEILCRPGVEKRIEKISKDCFDCAMLF